VSPPWPPERRELRASKWDDTEWGFVAFLIPTSPAFSHTQDGFFMDLVQENSEVWPQEFPEDLRRVGDDPRPSETFF